VEEVIFFFPCSLCSGKDFYSFSSGFTLLCFTWISFQIIVHVANTKRKEKATLGFFCEICEWKCFIFVHSLLHK
jgi:hypothetical protein